MRYWKKYRRTVDDSLVFFSKKELIEISASALALSFLLYYINSSPNAVMLAFYSCTSTLSVSAIFFLLKSNRALYAKKTLRENFIEYLYRIVYYKARGGSSLRIVEKASGLVEPGRLKKAAEQAAKKYWLSGNFVSHIKALEELKSYKPVADSGEELSDTIRSCNLYARSRQAELESTAQRYATFGMFISTILPSFLVFAFIGNAIISQGIFGMLFFSLLLLILVPLAYSVTNTLMWRRLLA